MSSQVFDLSVNAMSAWDQVKCLIIGAGFSGLGFLVLGYKLYIRRHSERVNGTLIGVRQKDNYYYPVYRYTMSNGQSVETTSGVGSNILPREKAGTIPLLVLSNSPQSSYAANNYLFEGVGFVFGMIGLGLLYHGCVAYPFNLFTLIIMAFTIIHMGFHVRNIFVAPRKDGLSIFQLINQMKAQGQIKQQTDMAAIPVQPIAQMAASPEMQKQMAQQAKYKPQIRAVLLLVGPLLIIGAAYMSQKTYQLAHEGVHAEGVVASLDSQWNSSGKGGYTYFPIIDFTTQNGQKIHFRDKFGSNPPSYRTGENVPVIYLADKPMQSASIDHGPGNWLVPGALLLLGIIFSLIGMKLSKKS